MTNTDTPTIRFEQTNLSGFTAHTWDVAANESNFFVRDATSESRVPFRIRPGAPTNSLAVGQEGNVGLGTFTPSSHLALVRDYAAADVVLSAEDAGETSDPLDNVTLFELDAGGNLTLAGDLTAAGINYPSSVHLKEHFAPVDVHDVLARLVRLPLATWSYTKDAGATPHLGPTAQDFHAAFGLGADDEHLSPVDANGVTMAAVQALYAQLQATQSRTEALARQNADLLARLAALEEAVQALQAKQP